MPWRAFGPSTAGPSDSGSVVPSAMDAETRPLRAIPLTDSPSSPASPAETDTVVLRRLAASPSSPLEPSPVLPAPPPLPGRAAEPTPTADHVDAVQPSTPVPPPVPVLPDPPALPASAGRRFSASTDPLEPTAFAAPRRSAASVASPPSPLEPAPPVDDTVLTKVTDAGQQPPDAPPTAPTSGSGPVRRRNTRALMVIAAVAVVGLVVAGAVWAMSLPRSTTVAEVSPTASATVIDPLLTSEDLATLSAGVWAADTESTSPTDESPRPLCLPAGTAGLPQNQSSGMRRLTSADGGTSVIHYVNSFADDTAAGSAYTERAAQVGTCPDTQALILDGYAVTGLGDDSIASTVTVQSNPAQYHTLLVNRSGRSINLFDVTTADKPASPTTLVQVAAKALARQCSHGDLTCPSTPKVKKEIPAAGAFPGWLVEADLPRVTTGAGRWGATEPAARLAVVGSQCEALDLNNVTGTSGQWQRTFLLADDPNAPTGFGLDQAVYTFDAKSAATALTRKLTDNIRTCARRTPTATVSGATTVKGSGASGVAISGTLFRVSQKVDANRTLLFRVAVLTVGNRVGYLLANPSSGFDFTDKEWSTIAVRAGQRISQSA